MKFIRKINENILDDLNIRYEMRNGEVMANSSIDLSNRGLNEITIKFGWVNGSIDVSGNKLETFEFLPYEAKKYILNNNPGVTGNFGDIVNICSRNEDYTDLFNKFIYECLDNDVWYHGVTNQDVIHKLWADTKLRYYNKSEENKNILFDKLVDVIDSNDIGILSDFFKLDSDSIKDSDSLLDAIIDNLKSTDSKVRLQTYIIINSLARSGDEKIKTMFDERGIGDSYNKIRKEDISNLEDWKSSETKSRVNALLKMMHKKISRSSEEKERDDNYDCFVFNGRETFVENDTGSYDKKLEIESMIKVDIYNLDHNQSVSLMKVRARSQGDLETYVIRMEKDMMDMIEDDEDDNGKDVWHNDDIPDYMMSLLNKNKLKI